MRPSSSSLDFQSGTKAPASDGRFDTPAFHRNIAPILEVLKPRLGGLTGNILEIGSGSGQHCVAFARTFSDLTWWPSDPYMNHLASIRGWREASDSRNLKEPVRLDARNAVWAPDREEAEWPEAFQAVIAINVLHIAPWDVACGLLSGAASVLNADGVLYVYGPFRRDGAHTAPSNAAFDARLRGENPEWGVRDTCDLEVEAGKHGLKLAQAVPMPANNHILIFSHA